MAKFVQSLELETRFFCCRNEKATAAVPFPQVTSQGLSDEQLFLKEKLRQQRSSIRRSGNGTGTVAFWCSLQFVTGTVPIFRIANRLRANGKFLCGFPMRELPRRSMHEELSTRHEISLTRSRLLGINLKCKPLPRCNPSPLKEKGA